jgi:hypothetical protein
MELLPEGDAPGWSTTYAECDAESSAVQDGTFTDSSPSSPHWNAFIPNSSPDTRPDRPEYEATRLWCAEGTSGLDMHQMKITPNKNSPEAEMVEEHCTETAAEKNASVKKTKNRYCEACKKEFGTPWNFKRHLEEKHTANNTAEITAKKEIQNERRNIRRKERYANDLKYKEKMKQLSITGRLKKRGRVEIEEVIISNAGPDYQDKVNGNEEDTVSPREGGEVTDSFDESKAKKMDT